MGEPVEPRTDRQQNSLTFVPLLTHNPNIEDERPENRRSSGQTLHPYPLAMVPPGPRPYSGGRSPEVCQRQAISPGNPGGIHLSHQRAISINKTKP